ncbi:hypothetical protein AFE_2164 [Acidithiobacillus ferrooxidans ATCC 23270]|uniref:Uncharacterized protein n=1 Tax=Acidithiobacillus ferrooxidans (strain ATCC 23270 / DSM 14882 / CIP 104768 / NCIMB 8455) TaxID=243159 RepID=B7J5F2_ACIF2|nr:hypothetical protein AFE_2164 [Acidithiobacillus ferrooxidans ATCC 23270]
MFPLEMSNGCWEKNIFGIGCCQRAYPVSGWFPQLLSMLNRRFPEHRCSALNVFLGDNRISTH